MGIHVKPMVDPLVANTDARPIVAQSSASRLLQHELERYCNGQSQGRSFLIAGHRGAGKTTMIHNVIRNVQDLARGHSFKLRPLPVFLHGPSLFLPEATNAGAKEIEIRSDLPLPGAPLPEKPSGETSAEIESQAQHALTQVILGLHKSVVKEFADAFRTQIKQKPKRPAFNAELIQDQDEWPELAAQFEIELTEDPRAARLREFYSSIGALQSGVLDRSPLNSTQGAPYDQGSRELVALNGICMAHQRISGTMSGQERERASAELREKAALGFHYSDLVKPLSSILSGSFVLGGAAAGNHGLVASATLGLATALATSFAFNQKSNSQFKREREVDRTFIPDLSLRTLDRLLPMLMDRLMDAGLAPVLVIDELDKMGDLSQRLETMARHLKKLMAEKVFSCFLTDRGYLEYVTQSERERAYSPIYSYFTHALFVCYEPRDLDDYLSELLDARGDRAAENDLQLFKWLLRHRSQMHALQLNRELLSIRTRKTVSRFGTGEDEVDITSAEIRQSPVYTIDITLQVAIEHELGKRKLQHWLQQSPSRRLTLMDALYYISRKWLGNAHELDLSDAGLIELWKTLQNRSNVREVWKFDPTESDAESSGDGSNGTCGRTLLDEADKKLLAELVRGLARELSRPDPGFRPDSERETLSESSSLGEVTAVQQVLACVLYGDNSVLEVVDSTAHRYRFRTRLSELESSKPSLTGVVNGDPLAAAGTVHSSSALDFPHPRSNEDIASSLVRPAQKRAAMIDAFEERLKPYFTDSLSASPSGRLFIYLTEEFGVLPIKLPAVQMLQAKQRIETIDFYANLEFDQIAEDATTLESFWGMVASNFSVIHAAIATATSICQLRTKRPLHEAFERGLAALSAGLRFNQHGPDNTRRALANFHLQLADVFSHPPPYFDWRSDFDDDDPALRIVSSVEQWLQYAELARPDVFQWRSLEKDAWMSYTIDSRDMPVHRSPRPFPISIILCVANVAGPALHFKRNPFAPVVQDWTDLLMTMLDQATERSKPNNPESEDVPPVLIKTALTALGFNMVMQGAVARYLEELVRRELIPKDYEDWIREGFEVPAKPVDPGLVNQVAIVLKSQSRSGRIDNLTSALFQPLVVTTPSALMQASDGFIHLITATRDVLLIWETAPDSAIQAELRDRLLSEQKIKLAESLLRQTRYS